MELLTIKHLFFRYVKSTWMNKFVYVKLHASRSLLVCLAIRSSVIKTQHWQPVTRERLPFFFNQPYQFAEETSNCSSALTAILSKMLRTFITSRISQVILKEREGEAEDFCPRLQMSEGSWGTVMFYIGHSAHSSTELGQLLCLQQKIALQGWFCEEPFWSFSGLLKSSPQMWNLLLKTRHSTMKTPTSVIYPNGTPWAEAIRGHNPEVPWQSPVLPTPPATRTAKVLRKR